ncbi:MAG: hypothetical protein E7266_04630 [Lachnospiraceae bacterium]|nr:hypothetical protein [Lachnospiraceae bacterium]
MFDADIKLFDLNFPTRESKGNALVINGCNAFIKKNGNKEVYSELEEMSYVYLNCNDYDQKMEMEFCFCNNQDNLYPRFWARCFAIRTDIGMTYKINGMRNTKPGYSKVNMYNQMTIGVGIFIDEEVYENLINANIIVIEGNIAIGKKTNIYKISIKLEKKNNEFKVVHANTFKTYLIRNIDSLCH